MNRDAAHRLERWLSRAMGEPVRVGSAVTEGDGTAREIRTAVVMVDGDASSRRRLRVVLGAARPQRTPARSRPEEFALLVAAHAAGVRVPRPLFLCEDTSVLGAPFFVSALPGERGDGDRIARSSGDGAENPGIPRAAEGEPGQSAHRVWLQRSELAAQLGRELAKLHRIIPPRDEFHFLARMPGDLPAVRIGAFRSRLDAIGDPHPVLEWTMRALERNAPERTGTVLCHGAPVPGSCLVDGAILVAVRDWEASRWGDPCEDIGVFRAACRRLASRYPEGGDAAARAGILDGYREGSDLEIDEDRARYWEIMATLDHAVSALEQGHRFVAGGKRAIELALTGRGIAEMEIDLLTEMDRLAMERAHA